MGDIRLLQRVCSHIVGSGYCVSEQQNVRSLVIWRSGRLASNILIPLCRLGGQPDRSQAIILLIHAVVFVLTDVALFIAPIRIFSTQMIDKARMFKVVLIFSVGE